MHTLRTSSTLIRLVLAWFALTLGVAVASPWVHPQAMELVCSASGGVQVLVVDGDGKAVPAGHHTLDCPMCLAATLPPVTVATTIAHASPLSHVLHPIAAAHIAALVGAPLPPRGPPFLS